MLATLRDRVRSEGLGATGRAAARRLRKLAYMREEHLWYQCDLDDSRPRRDMPEEVRLVRAEPSEVGAWARLGRDPDEARECLDGGNDVWLALDGDEPLFACFTFRSATPVAAASGGMLPLPPGTACLEDSVTSAAARGRGIAPAAWTLIGDELARAGFKTIVTKIETDNVPSRRAVEKVGYRPVAVMRYRRVGSRRRTAVRPLGGLGEELATRLS